MFRAFDDDIYAAPAWLESALTGPCEAIGLPHLAQVFHIAFLACGASFLLQRLSHIISPVLFPQSYPKLVSKQHDWDLHIVSIRACTDFGSCLCRGRLSRLTSRSPSPNRPLLSRPASSSGRMGILSHSDTSRALPHSLPFARTCRRQIVRLRLTGSETVSAREWILFVGRESFC